MNQQPQMSKEEEEAFLQERNLTKIYVWMNLGPIDIKGAVHVKDFEKLEGKAKIEEIARATLEYLMDLGLEWDWSLEPFKDETKKEADRHLGQDRGPQV